jgi:hypothetical protein
MHGPINVKSPNNISKWQMGFNSAFKGLMCYIKFLFQIPNKFGRKEIIYTLTTFFGHPVTKFKVCQSMHHHTIPINKPTGYNNFSNLT